MEWLKDALGKLVGGAGDGQRGFKDKRRYLRTRCVERIMCVVSEEAVSVLVTELSLMGMRVRLPRKLESDDVLTFRAHREVKKRPQRDAVEPPPPLAPSPVDTAERPELQAWGVPHAPAPAAAREDETETEAVPFKARVIWVRRHAQTGEFEAGLAFTEIRNLDRDRWTRSVLRASGAPDSTMQRRENIRVCVELPFHFRLPTGYEADGTLLDLSSRGLQARTELEIEKGTELVMLVSTGASGTSLPNLKGRVTRCKRDPNGGWRIGVSLDGLSVRDQKSVLRCMAYLMKQQALAASASS